MKTFVSLLCLTAAVLALGACGVVAKGKGALGGDRPDIESAAGDSPVADVPQLGKDEDDPPHVVAALNRLDEMEKQIAERKWASYARESSSFQSLFLFNNGFEGEKKRKKMKKRLDALDAAAFKAFGGRLHKLVGDGSRITEGVDPDGIEAVEVAVDACQSAAGTSTTGSGDAQDKLADAIAAYEKAAARARKIDKKSFHYFGEVKSGARSIDVPTALMTCETQLAELAVAYGDEYIQEKPAETGTERGCGTVEWLADGVLVGSGRFGPYSRTEGGASFAEKVPCKKLARKNKFPKNLKAAVAEFKDYTGVNDMVVVAVGKPYIEEDDDDYRLHQYQRLIAYSKKFEFASNPCGGGAKLFCEAGGSRGARAYNEMEHHLDRAQVHAGSVPDRCKEHLKAAVQNWENFQQIRDELTKSGNWISGATYKTKKGAKLKEKDFIASFEDKAKRADDRLLAKYCNKPAKREDREPAEDRGDEEGEEEVEEE
jgi:hypothetical protein